MNTYEGEVTALERISQCEDRITIIFLIDSHTVIAEDLINSFIENKKVKLNLDKDNLIV